MKNISHQPKALILGIALALGVATLAGCSQGYDDNGTAATAPSADANGSMAAGSGDSAKPVSDTWITTKVKASLATMNGVNNTDVDVETNNGVVTLSGTASSDASLAAMKSAAMRINGVTSVNTMGVHIDAATDNANAMSAGSGAGDSQAPVKDSWITTKVLAKLQTVDGLDNTDIAVETNNGTVLLTGHADSQQLINAAVAATKTIEGVKQVDTSMLKIGTDTSH
ncbi:MAG: BON domain-containing protein [Xanthomonadales bacterium]|nr:BON domain-containing protein [Xanthomonadales bacterium]